MIPVFLSFEGIYSYQQKQIIDFTSLTNVGLFGIFGATGSGKSTILDAITFALYGEIERLNSREARMYNMMNLRSNELHIDFHFKVQESLYKFTVDAKRNKKKFEETPKFERVAFKFQDNQWIALESANAEQIIGLSYKNFKRTVIIPQGQFMEFISLPSAERMIMIKELFNLEQFDLAAPTSVLDKMNDENLYTLKGKSDQLGEINIEDIESLKIKIQQTEELIKTKEVEFADVSKKKKEFDEILSKTEKFNVLTAQYLQYNEKTEEINTLEQSCNDYEYCLVHFKDLLVRITESEKIITQTSESITATQKNREIIKTKLLEKEIEFKNKEVLVAQHQNKENLISDFKIVLSLLSIYKQLDIEKKRIPVSEKAIEDVKVKHNSLVEKYSEIKQNLALLKNKNIDLVQLHARKIKFSEFEILNKENNSQKSEFDKRQRALKEKKEKLSAIVSNYSIDSSADFTVLIIKELIHTIEHEIIALQESIIKKEAELNTHRVQVEIKKIAYELKEGQACPVCGSLTHPATKSLHEISTEVLLLEKEIESFNSNLNQHKKNQKEVEVLWSEVELSEGF
ncbi:MAG: AAA family ATPase [Bacteroidales bacterium]|nr:AAA family ATPase [Bacteroidales bacterium]